MNIMISIPSSVLCYGDIIYLGRPAHEGDLFSRRHPKMSQQHRAKLFAPFAALEGFDDRVRRKEAVYVPKRELDADQEWALNRQLYELHCLTANSRLARTSAPRIAVEYFVLCTDPENDAFGNKGQYMTLTGFVLRADPVSQSLIVQTETSVRVIPFADIYRICNPPAR